jgi:acyl transferase domain-containing protein/NAD(P)-dependent dehydrogenase (short-subunit alcohol dehydrogenase family)
LAPPGDNTTATQSPIAIVGMGCLFPRAHGLKDYWRLLRTSEDGVTDVPETHWSLDDYFHPEPGRADLTYCRRGAFLQSTDFDPTEFGIPPAVLEATDTAQLLGLVVAKAALEDAGYGQDTDFDRTRTSVILGVTGTLELVIPLGARLGHPKWRRAMREAGVPDNVAESIIGRIADDYVSWQENSFPGLLGNVVAGRIANRLDLRGTNCVVDAACASSLGAIHLAMLELASGRTDMVLSGGVDALNDVFMFMCFSKTQALSSTGDTRPFAKDADGTVIGEGLGMVVLKRLEDAERDGDRIYAVIRGIGTSSDGRSQSIYAPRASGQTRALRDAYAVSGVDPSTVQLVEAHGTGTKVGDAVEFDALRTVYSAAASDAPWCALGSVKSQIGHTKAAAGAAGLIKAALALHHKVLPATIKVTEPNPGLKIEDSPFYLNTQTRPWLGQSAPRRSSVSAFGFGGSNFHAVLEEYVGQDECVAWDGSTQIIGLSADTIDSLRDSLNTWRRFLAETPSADALAYQALESRKHFSSQHTLRLTLVAASDTDLATLIQDATTALETNGHDWAWTVPGVFFGATPPQGAVAFLFPGQASQYVGMGRDVTCMFPEARDAIAAADAGARADGAESLSGHIFPTPVFDDGTLATQQAALTQTEVAQPAIGAVSLAMLRVVQRFGVYPDFTAGHSYGELVALRAAGRIDDEELRRLSTVRGQLMATGTGNLGTMLAVQAPLTELDQLLVNAGIDVVLANRNAPSQGVLSGTRDAIAEAAQACTDRGWRTTPLQVSAAFHSPLMEDAVEPFRRDLDLIHFAPGTVPVYANCTAQPYDSDMRTVRDTLARQLVSPVNFVDELEHLYTAGVRTFVEVGPGTVLTSLVRATFGDRPYEVAPVDASSGRGSGVTDLAKLLAQLAALGQSIDLAAWEPNAREPRQTKMAVPLLGTNYRSPRSRDSERPPITTAPETSGHPVSNHANDMSTGNADGSTAVTPATDTPLTPEAQATSTPSSARAAQIPAAPPQTAGVLEVVQEGLRAMQVLQQQTAEAHLRFLEGQESAHKTIQLVMEGQQRLVEGGSPLPTSAPRQAETATVATALDEHPRATAPAAPETSPSVFSPAASPALVDNEPAGQTAPFSQPDRPGLSEPTTPSLAPPVAEGDETHAEGTLLEVVAELTGYPIEMLDVDMDLEADLGIDSIKRLEILAALQTRLPDMAAVDSAYVGSLRTLRNIIEYMRANEGAAAVPDGDAPTVRPDEPQAASTPSEPDTVAASPLRRELSAMELPTRSDGGRIELAVGREVWIVDDGTGLAQALCDQFAAQGRTAHVIPADGDDGGHAMARIGGLIVLGSPDSSTASAWSASSEAQLKHAFALTKQVGPMLREAAAGGGALFATVSRMDGAFGLSGGEFDAVQGGLAGLTKTVAQEWPALRCKALDVSRSWRDHELVAAAIVGELAAEGPLEIGLDDSGRRGLQLTPVPIPSGQSRCGSDDVIVLTGGARGVTAAVACALAAESQPTLVLLGRSAPPEPEPVWLADVTGEAAIKRALLEHGFASAEPPTPTELEATYRRHVANREVADTIERITRAGSHAVYRSVDVRDEAAVTQTIGDIRQNMGRIRGVIHAAGVLEDRWIDDKTVEQFARVFDTKVAGLRHLLEAVSQDELAFLALFSSVSGRFGRQGQVDYAMANEVLNKVAQRQASDRPSCRVVAIDWGPWDGGMVTPALKRDFARSGVGVIPLEAGARSLLDELAHDEGGATEVVIGDVLPESHDDDPGRPRRPVTAAQSGLSPVFERRLDIDRHAFLNSHVIGGYPVLPVAIMQEWLAHGALHDNPGLLLGGFAEFRVLKGVILNNGPRDLRVVVSKIRRCDDSFEVDVELRSGPDADQTAHARACAVLHSALPAAPAYARPSDIDAQNYGYSVDAAYREVLFHGPHFHGIERIDGYSPNGLVAHIRSAPAPSEWMDDPLRSTWLGDPLIVDAGLQMGILWCHKALGSVSLPTFGARYEQYTTEFPTDGVVAILEVREHSPQRVTGDITFLDATGTVLARMEGYAWTVDPSLRDAFRPLVAQSGGARSSDVR